MSSVDTHLPYVFWWNEKRYTVDADIFERLSTEFKKIRQMPENENQMVVNYPIEESTFVAFLAACQFQHFDVNKKNVHQLKKLAEEWGVASLKEYTEKYIRENNVEESYEDILGTLLDKVKRDEDGMDDWSKVALDINKAMTDPRFKELPTEVIYQILAIADRKTLDQEIFKDFVLQLFEVNPTKAVPLLLRVDFSLLTYEQRDMLYKMKEIHKININFFIASSISAIQNKTKIQLNNELIKQKIDLDVLRVKSTIRKQKVKETKDTAYNDKMKDLKDKLAEQKQDIDKLNKEFSLHNRRIQIVEQKLASCRSPIDRTVIETVNQHALDTIDATSKEANERLNGHFKEIENFYSSVGDEAKEYFKNMTMNSENMHLQAKAKLDDLMTKKEEVGKDIKTMTDQMTDVKSLLCAKVVRDKIRFDEFLRRRTDSKFSIFDKEPKIMNLTSNDVREGDKLLKKMENKLDELCPMRLQSPKKK